MWTTTRSRLSAFQSASPRPQSQPRHRRLHVAGERLDGAAGFTARTETYIIEPLLAEGHIETYRYRASSGEVEFRTEEPYFGWFTELGSASAKNGARFDQPFSLIPYTSVEWTAPKAPRRDHHPRGRAGSPRRDGLALTDGQRFVRRIYSDLHP